MNNKITFPELVEQVAQNAHTSKRMSELFLKELFATISQTLIDGESVKVKGIGTFKLTEVSARKSVDVNTGEEIEIPGHKKLSFAPDKDLAEAINQPFMHFETEILDDDVTDEQLAAIDAEGASPASAPVEKEAETKVEPETPAEAEAEAKSEVEPEVETEAEVEMPPAFVAPADGVSEVEDPAAKAEAEEPAAEPQLKQPTEPADNVDESAPEPGDEAVEQAEPEAEPQTDSREQDAADEPQADEPTYGDAADGELVSEELADERVGQEVDKRRITRRSLFEGFVVGVVTTLIVTLFAYRLYLMKGYGADEKPKAAQALVADSVTADSVKGEQPASIAKTSADAEKEQQTAMQQQQQQQAEEAKKKAAEEAKAKAAAAKTAGAPTTDTIKVGTNLYRMSRKHYGTDKFWVYIYEENKAKYPNPNAIPVGAVLRVPSLEKYGVKAGDAASLKAAKQKQSEIFNHLSSPK